MSLFITFEGPEGSGKSTQVALLYEYLDAGGLPVVQTREPGGTPIGDLIRQVLFSPESAAMTPAAEFLLFSAARAQLISQFVRPRLEAGYIVLCDRYADSSLAYQGYGRALDLDLLRRVTAFATGGLVPDLTFYLDLDVAEGLRRKRHGNSPLDRLDSQTLEFHERVRQGYLEMARQEPRRWIVIPAGQPVMAVQASLRQCLEQVIQLRSAPRAEEVP